MNICASAQSVMDRVGYNGSRQNNVMRGSQLLNIRNHIYSQRLAQDLSAAMSSLER